MLFDWPQSAELPAAGIAPLAADRHSEPNSNEIKALTTALLNFTPIDRQEDAALDTSLDAVLVEPRQRYVGHAAVTGFQDSIRPAHPKILQTTNITQHEPNTILTSKAQQHQHKALPLVAKHNNMHHPSVMPQQPLLQVGRKRDNCSERRPSRAIAIPRPTNSNGTMKDDDRRDMESAMLEYDYATWRLYNRLILHRQRRRTRLHHTVHDELLRSTSAEDQDENVDRSNTNHKSKPSTTTTPMHEEYGGVFDLEL